MCISLVICHLTHMCKSLVVSILLIFPLMRDPNFRLKLPNVCFLYTMTCSQRFCLLCLKDRCVRISRNAIFLEQIPFYSLRPASHPVQVSYLHQVFESTSPPPSTEVYVSQAMTLPLTTPSLDHPSFSALDPPGNDPPDPQPLRHSSCITVPPNRYGFPSHFTSLDSTPIPTSYSRVSIVPCWQDAMTKELLILKANSTWDLVPALIDVPIIDSKWVYSIIVKYEGSLDRYKAQLT